MGGSQTRRQVGRPQARCHVDGSQTRCDMGFHRAALSWAALQFRSRDVLFVWSTRTRRLLLRQNTTYSSSHDSQDRSMISICLTLHAIKTFFEYEEKSFTPNLSDNRNVKGRLKSHIQYWHEIGANEDIINTICDGYKLPFFCAEALIF